MNDEVGGVCGGRGCVHLVFAIRQLIERACEKKRKLFMAFIDSEKAYDRANRENPWEVLKIDYVEGRLLNAGKSI